MDLPGKARSYKCFGAESRKICNSNFFSLASHCSVNTHSDGQHSCSFIFGKNGWYSKSISKSIEQRNLGLFVEQRDRNYCRVPPRVTECGGRCSIENSKGCQRVEVKSQCISKDLPEKGNSRHRSFCFSNISPSTNIHLLETGPVQPREGCFPNDLDQQKRICFPSFLSNRSIVKKGSNRSGNIDSSHPRMAKSILVSSTSTNVSTKSLTSSQHSQSFDRTKQTKPSTSRKSKLATPGMDSFREKLYAEGISKESALLITSARRSGTLSHYESAWRQWDSWCVGRQVDPIRCPLKDVLQFLTECFQKGYKYNTIAGFRSAISAFHDPVDGVSVGKNQRVSVLLTGVFNENPPQPKFTFIWDVRKVIEYLGGERFHTNITLKDLTLKLTMLLALTSAGRASDICYLDSKYLTKHSSGYIFQFGKVTKTSTRSRQRKPLKFYPFKEDKNLCVCHHIDLYLDRVKHFRKEETQLLLSFIQPHKSVATSTISR